MSISIFQDVKWRIAGCNDGSQKPVKDGQEFSWIIDPLRLLGKGPADLWALRQGYSNPVAYFQASKSSVAYQRRTTNGPTSPLQPVWSTLNPPPLQPMPHLVSKFCATNATQPSTNWSTTVPSPRRPLLYHLSWSARSPLGTTIGY